LLFLGKGTGRHGECFISVAARGWPRLRLGVSCGGAWLSDGSRLGEMGKFQSVSGLESHRTWRAIGGELLLHS
jgi:hypothetical protein